jgi:succinylglutamic semialdehyde dehydrogenase
MLAPHPEKLLALEMGGNNPMVVSNVSNLDAAVYAIIQSAFITAGQRCTCARRLILLQDGQSDRLVDRLSQLTEKIVVGPYTVTPEPFIGPVISDAAAQRLLDAQSALISRGAKAILPLRSIGPRLSMLAPGILDVIAVADRADEELFGPLLQVIRVPDFDAALSEANKTRFGLAAALLSDDPALYQRFLETVHAGIINWNRPTTGASGNLPFGGRGASGNHRPAGFFAVDFCADPVACLESPTLTLPSSLSPGISL